MAASYNKVFLMGNLTRDPETRVTPGGLTIAKLGLAVNRRYRTKEGEQREEVTFVDIDAFGSQAETIQKYCSKGSGIFVEGRLKLDQWQDKNSGENRSKLAVVLEGFQFVGGRGGEEGSSGASSGEGYEQSSPPRRSSPPARSPSAAPADDFSDDDVPF
jgi:single-strand DNA-binding protein